MNYNSSRVEKMNYNSSRVENSKIGRLERGSLRNLRVLFLFCLFEFLFDTKQSSLQFSVHSC